MHVVIEKDIFEARIIYMVITGGYIFLSHLNSETLAITTGGYFCPQCDSKYCEIPVECRACG